MEDLILEEESSSTLTLLDNDNSELTEQTDNSPLCRPDQNEVQLHLHADDHTDTDAAADFDYNDFNDQEEEICSPRSQGSYSNTMPVRMC